MDLRNLMEDKVIQVVNEICDEEEERGTSQFCTSEPCRVDVACFVLNRIPQRYVSSGRGFAYLETDLNKNMQLHVDLVTLVHDGLQRVSEIQRSFYREIKSMASDQDKGDLWAFHFPLIKGRLFSASNFEPISFGSVRLSCEQKLIATSDASWPNPYPLLPQNPGTFLFKPLAIGSENEFENRLFELTINFQHDDFELFEHTFTINVSSLQKSSSNEKNVEHQLGDLFVIPKARDDYDMQLNLMDPDEPS